MIDEKDKDRQEFLRTKRSADRIDTAGEMRERRLKYIDLALCAKCRHVHAETTQYGTHRYWCTESERLRILSPSDPIIDCTGFWDVAHRPLRELMEIAIPIDVGRRRIGFDLDNEEYEDWEDA